MEFLNAHLLFNVFVIFSMAGVNVVSAFQPGQCSNKCSSQQLVETFGEKIESCSCSPSCFKFGDCCFDSPFRKVDTVKLPTVCLPVEDNNLYSAISSCPESWRDSSEFCLTSTGHLSPVTSLSTGSTYTNIYCAVCNDDSSNITIWDVELKCCSKHEYKFLQNEKFKHTKVGFYFREYSFLRWFENREGRVECPCRFKARNDRSFVPKSTELRQCQTRTFHLRSSCPSNWLDVTTRQQCMSYFDPVYVHESVYKNIHCAICNFDDVSEASCIPGIVTFMKKRNKSLKEIREFCRNNHITSCLHYFSSKGRSWAFSEMFSTSVKECIPPSGSGRRCCEGWQYNFYSKRCKKVHSE